MRKAFYALAKSIESRRSYRLKKLLSEIMQILVIWVILMLMYYVGSEVIAALTF